MSIKLTWKDNTTREVLYEIYKIDTVSGDRVKIADVPSGPVPNDRDGTYEWIGGGEWDCGDQFLQQSPCAPHHMWYPHRETRRTMCLIQL